MSLTAITAAATDRALTDRMISAAAKLGIEAPDARVGQTARQIVSVDVDGETIAAVLQSAVEYLEAHRAAKEADINSPGHPPLRVALAVEPGEYHAAVSDSLILAAVAAVLTGN